MSQTISLIFEGEIAVFDDWGEVIEKISHVFEICQSEITHVGIGSDNCTSGKIRVFKKKNVMTKLAEAKNVNYLTFLSLPPNYSTASFDYDVMLAINIECDFIAVIMEKSIYKANHKDEIIDTLSQYVKSPYKVEVVELDKAESPILYAGKINPISYFKTLHIIDNYNVQ